MIKARMPPRPADGSLDSRLNDDDIEAIRMLGVHQKMGIENYVGTIDVARKQNDGTILVFGHTPHVYGEDEYFIINVDGGSVEVQERFQHPKTTRYDKGKPEASKWMRFKYGISREKSDRKKQLKSYNARLEETKALNSKEF